jgi:hypothetical protein
VVLQAGREMVCEGRLVTFQVLHQEKSVVGAKVRKYILPLRVRGVYPGSRIWIFSVPNPNPQHKVYRDIKYLKKKLISAQKHEMR